MWIKYILIVMGLLLLAFLSSVNRGKAGTCCPFSARSFDQLDEKKSNEY